MHKPVYSWADLVEAADEQVRLGYVFASLKIDETHPLSGRTRELAYAAALGDLAPKAVEQAVLLLAERQYAWVGEEFDADAVICSDEKISSESKLLVSSAEDGLFMVCSSDVGDQATYGYVTRMSDVRKYPLNPPCSQCGQPPRRSVRTRFHTDPFHSAPESV